MNYFDIYLKRLNRYGLDYYSRLQGQRERNFDNYLLKTPFRVDIQYQDTLYPASLERYKQDYSETLAYLLTKIDVLFDNGTILDVVSQNGVHQYWMVWWLEHIESGGYNKYVILKMTHTLAWKAAGQDATQLGFLRGPGTGKIQDAIRSKKDESLWTENDNLYMFITPYNKDLKKDMYLTTIANDDTIAFIITDIDSTSTSGILYISIDPTLLRDENSTLVQTQNSDDSYWLNGGN